MLFHQANPSGYRLNGGRNDIPGNRGSTDAKHSEKVAKAIMCVYMSSSTSSALVHGIFSPVFPSAGSSRIISCPWYDISHILHIHRAEIMLSYVFILPPQMQQPGGHCRAVLSSVNCESNTGVRVWWVDDEFRREGGAGKEPEKLTHFSVLLH